MATIFAWSGALRKRGELDGLDDLVAFADKLERATLDTIEAGEMTGDLALITTLPNPKEAEHRDFILAIAETLGRRAEKDACVSRKVSSCSPDDTSGPLPFSDAEPVQRSLRELWSRLVEHALICKQPVVLCAACD